MIGMRGTIVIAAWFAAAIAGALVIVLQILVVAGVAGLIMGWPATSQDLLALPGLLLAIFLVAFGMFLVGLLAVGGPVWLTLHGVGRHGRRDAIVAGALLAGLTAGLLVLSVQNGHDLWLALPWGAATSVAGAAAGWTLHRVAYGRALQEAPRPLTGA